MGTTPTLLLPYPEPTDPADVPTDMNELATRIEAVRGATNGLASLDSAGKVPVAQLPATPTGDLEIVYTLTTTDATAVVPGSPGSPFYTFNAATYQAVKHYLELFFPVVRCSTAATLYWQLMESGAAVAGAAAAGVDIPNLSTYGGGVAVALRIPFTPTAGNHTYGVNWIGNGSASFTVRATGLAPPTARIVRP